MAVVPIRIVGDPVLHTATTPVPVGDDGSLPAELAELIANLFDTMDAANGVGLAANQIGASLLDSISSMCLRIDRMSARPTLGTAIWVASGSTASRSS